MEHNQLWFGQFDERQQKEIRFSDQYAVYFGHGTDGHNAKLIISKMAGLLDKYESKLDDASRKLEELHTKFEKLVAERDATTERP